MAHPAQFQFIGFIKASFPSFFSNKKVLEIGSLDINGSARKFYDNCDYLGLDVGDGPGVDVVCGGQEYKALSGSFDVVTSFEAMEHNPYWRETFLNMIRLCRPGGLVILSCATLGRKEHGTINSLPEDSPLSIEIGWDYYKNLTAEDFKKAFDLNESFCPYRFYYNHESHDLYFVGFRKGIEENSLAPKESKHALRSISLQYLARNFLKPKSFINMLLIRIIGEKRFLKKMHGNSID